MFTHRKIEMRSYRDFPAQRSTQKRTKKPTQPDLLQTLSIATNVGDTRHRTKVSILMPFYVTWTTDFMKVIKLATDHFSRFRYLEIYFFICCVITKSNLKQLNLLLCLDL